MILLKIISEFSSHDIQQTEIGMVNKIYVNQQCMTIYQGASEKEMDEGKNNRVRVIKPG